MIIPSTKNAVDTNWLTASWSCSIHKGPANRRGGAMPLPKNVKKCWKTKHIKLWYNDECGCLTVMVILILSLWLGE